MGQEVLSALFAKAGNISVEGLAIRALHIGMVQHYILSAVREQTVSPRTREERKEIQLKTWRAWRLRGSSLRFFRRASRGEGDLPPSRSSESK